MVVDGVERQLAVSEVIEMHEFGGDGFEGVFAGRRIIDAAVGVKLAKVKRRDHHGSVRGWCVTWYKT